MKLRHSHFILLPKRAETPHPSLSPSAENDSCLHKSVNQLNPLEIRNFMERLQYQLTDIFNPKLATGRKRP